MSEPLLLAAIRWGSVGPLVLTSLALMGSPGPATISLTATGSTHGLRRSLAYLAGIVTGSVIVLVAVGTGITATLVAVPGLRPVLIAISAAYIVWLAYHVATAPAPAVTSASSAAPSFAGGTLLGVANPKAWVAIGAVVASSHLASSPTGDAAAKIAILTGMIVVISVTWLVAGASFAPLLSDPRRARLLNVALAGALVGATALTILR